MMRLDLSAPDYTTLSRRSQHLTRRLRLVPTDEGIHLVLDSTGLSIVGEGEWAAAKHGGRGRRGWRKLHLGVDQSKKRRKCGPVSEKCPENSGSSRSHVSAG